MKAKAYRAVDLFCGAGGFTSGAERAGMTVELAINHWRTAIYSHQANHPNTRHICARIEHVDARNDGTLPPFDVLLASPECTHHSIARGGRPVSDQKRQQPFALLDWIDAKRPRWICVENVREFRDWGPLVNVGTKAKPRWRPDPKRKGETYGAWLRAIESLGYRCDAQLLNAADYGAPTKRVRLFVLCCRNDLRVKEIPWPAATHAGRWRSAAEIIDWAKPCPSIFGRKRPLAEKTLRRIEIGLRKFVGPFITQFHAGTEFEPRNHSPSEPLRTLDTQNRYGLVVPFALTLRKNADGRTIADPLPTITAGAEHHGLVQPFIVPHFGERDGQQPRTHSCGEPLASVTGQGAGSLAMPFFLPRQGFYDCQKDKPAASVNDPLNTITAHHGPGSIVVPYLLNTNHGGDDDRSRSPEDPTGVLTTKNSHSVVVPFLTKYYGTGDVQGCDEALDTVTTKDRFGLAMASLIETMRELSVVDIGFRMLQPDELLAAQGFERDYYLHGSKEDQVKQIGNAVCPPVAEALCRTMMEAA